MRPEKLTALAPEVEDDDGQYDIDLLNKIANTAAENGHQGKSDKEWNENL